MAADGRLARSERQKEAIKRALMKFVRAGDYSPSAVDVANEAGTTVRTLFRHFKNREDLYASVTENTRIEPRSNVGRTITANTLHGRFEQAVDARMEFYEQNIPFAEFQMVNRHDSKFLQETYRNNLHESRMFMTMAFSGFIDPKDSNFDALEVVLSLANWRMLRHDFGKTPEEARDLILQSAMSLYPANVTNLISKAAV